MAKQNYGGVYANMEFPPYEFREFPKHISTGHKDRAGKSIFEIANTAEEELAIKKRIQTFLDNAPAEASFSEQDPEREQLAQRAKELNVPINRKWSIKKLQAVIASAEDSVDDLPPEENLAPDEIVSDEPVVEIATASDHLENEKDKLIAEAKSLGIAANKLWGIPRLRSEIAAAKE
jgi:hypothetical protein